MRELEGQKQKPTMDRAMTREHSFVAGDYSDRDLYASSRTRERALNSAIVDRKSTRLNSSHGYISYAAFCLNKKNGAESHPGSCPSPPSPGVTTHPTHAATPVAFISTPPGPAPGGSTRATPHRRGIP